MKSKFVLVTCDVICDCDLRYPPRYRAFVNDQLFTERTWIWQDAYLEETFQIQARSGEHQITYQLLDPESATLRIENFRVEGDATIDQQGLLRVE